MNKAVSAIFSSRENYQKSIMFENYQITTPFLQLKQQNSHDLVANYALRLLA